jgi:phosphoesterase RecJ-like protein
MPASMMNPGMKAVMAVMRRHHRFLISSHVNPEGDALGSALALASLLKRLGKRVVLANEGGIPEGFRFLPLVAPMRSTPNGKVTAEVSMIVDVPTLSRVGSIRRLIERIPLKVNIDHHVSNQRFADVNWVDPKAASVGEMIYRLYRSFHLKPSPAEALCIYVSLVTDTGSFRYMNTTPAVHRIASALIATGVSPLKVSQQLYESRRPSDLKFLSTVLSSLQYSRDGRVAWLEVPFALLKSTRASPEIIDELINFPRSLRSAEVAAVFRESPEAGKIRVSLRSKGVVDVNRVARVFGGGGHMAASGCTVEGTLEEAKVKVLKVARKAIREGVRRKG